MRVLALALLTGVLSPGCLYAQMLPLEEIRQTNPEESYEYARCAAFYLANVEWAGQAIGESTFNTSQKAVQDLVVVTALVRAADSADSFEHISSIVLLDVRQIADLYAENYRMSYAARGTAWEGNMVWESDLQLCQVIAEAAAKVVSGMGN